MESISIADCRLRLDGARRSPIADLEEGVASCKLRVASRIGDLGNSVGYGLTSACSVASISTGFDGALGRWGGEGELEDVADGWAGGGDVPAIADES